MAKNVADNSIDAIVTDPPYGLGKEPNMVEVLTHWLAGDDYNATGSGFMGKTWDSFVPGPSIWKEAYRCLKPGGYMLVFVGSRTQDLMATALRLSGFEIRDTLMWMYGSGFPKSLNVGKAIDKQDAVAARRARDLSFTGWMRDNAAPLDVRGALRDAGLITGKSNLAGHYFESSQPMVATQVMFDAFAHTLRTSAPAWVLDIIEARTIESENSKLREVLETKHDSAVRNVAVMSGKGDYDVTAAATDEAKKWGGYGTALKPAYEPIILCRKPLDGTVANNVLTHSTGALNIDGCRNGERWPANVLHDGCLPEPMDRYYYCAKTSKTDRDAGLETFDHHDAGECTGRELGSDGTKSPSAGAGRTGGARNIHPTVKPTELMRWCCRLVGHPGAVIMDPFSGSGSTGRGAVLEGFGFIGFEMSEEYCEIANARILDAIVNKR